MPVDRFNGVGEQEDGEMPMPGQNHVPGLIDGTQAEFVRIPHADSELYPVPEGVDGKALVMLSDILSIGLECGVLNGKVQPGASVALVGAGPVGLAAPDDG